MSLVFSSTENLNGILQLIEKELGFDYGFITGNARRLKEWTAEVNLTHDEVVAIGLKAGGTWQLDDTNHDDDFPFIETDLVSGQRKYVFTTDEQGNLILDIYRVFVKNPNGIYQEVFPVDQQTRQSDTSKFFDGQDATGTPGQYDKTGNGIIFDLVPNYNWRNANEGERGVKVFINREGSYFATNDTTKKPGVDGRIHEYYVVNPCYKYASRKNLKTVKNFAARKLELEAKISDIYTIRKRDEARRMTPGITSSK